MNKKSKLLMFLSVIIVVLIVLVVVIVIIGKNDNEVTDEIVNINELYGSWTSEYLNIYKGKKLETTYDSIYGNIITINDDNTVNICISDNDCYLVNYEYSNNKLIVDDNDTFLNGELTVKIENGYLVTMANMDNNRKSYLYYSKNIKDNTDY